MKSIFSSLLHASPLFCVLLIPSLVFSPLLAQSPLPASTSVPSVNADQVATSSALDNTDLQVRIVEGAAQEAQVNSTPAKGLIVSVTNAAGAAVPDAAVALRLPESGASGTFSDGSHAAVAYTDGSGRAQFTGLHWNQTPGTVTIRVTATKGTNHAALLVDQTLSALTVASAPAAKPAVAPPNTVAISQPAQMATLGRSAVQAPVQTPALAPAQKLAQNLPPNLAQPVAQSGASSAADVPLTPIPPAKPVPTVTVTGASADSTHHSGRTKWIIIAAAVAAAAGAGIAVAGKGKSTSTTASGITIGTPSVSVGAPTH
jgi:hypothetical protein